MKKSYIRGCFVVVFVVVGVVTVVVIAVVDSLGTVEKQPIMDRTTPCTGRSSIVFKIVSCTVETN